MKKSIKVLCVDDDREWCEILREIVSSRLDCQIEIATSYVDAVERLNNSTFHIVLLDLRLESTDNRNADGLRIAEFINGLNEGTRIIVFTAYSDINTIEKAFRELNVFDFIGKEKPVSVIVESIKNAAEEVIL